MVSTTYYQIGGFQPSVQWFGYDDKQLAVFLVGARSLRTPDGLTELVLGIKRMGTSHLLLTKQQTLDFIQTHQLSPPWRGKQPIPLSDFESVSPIHFRRPEDLVKKLSTLKPKSQKSRSPTDNSQANKYFVSGEDGIPRALFEHCRVFYDLILGRIPSLEKFGLRNPDWLPSLRVFSFTFNTFVNDTRPTADRLRNPKVIDVGWSELDLTTFSQKPGTSHHFRVLENTLLGGTTKRHDFNFGTSEELSLHAIFERLDALLGEQPTILLVHKEELSLSFLRKLGFDVSGWKSGIKNLLGYSDSVKDEYTERKDCLRRRSRSPDRKAESSSALSSRRSPPRRPSPSTIHVVDIRQLYLKLMQTEYAAETIPRMSRGLGCDAMEGLCAGNEAVQLFQIWFSMISGPAIDDQRALRVSMGAGRALPQMRQAPARRGGDEEQDPNDFAPGASSSIQYADPETDSTDYGSD